VRMSRRLGMAAILLFISAAASASPITYIVSGTGYGVLDGRTFNPALVTLTGSGADTTNRSYSGSILKNALGTVTVTVDGVGTDTITSPGLIAYANNYYAPPAAGISTWTGSLDTAHTILGTLSDALANYSLFYTGPITGDPTESSTLFATSRGNFILYWIYGQATFEAIPPPGPSEVPLPPTALLFATGLGALGLLGWRRKKKLAAESGMSPGR
jgi:hypothetical protein